MVFNLLIDNPPIEFEGLKINTNFRNMILLSALMCDDEIKPDDKVWTAIDLLFVDAPVDKTPKANAYIHPFFVRLGSLGTKYSFGNGDYFRDGIPPSEAIYYNPLHEYGVKEFTRSYHTNPIYASGSVISVSDDLVTWEDIPILDQDIQTVPPSMQQKKFWREVFAESVHRYRTGAYTPVTDFDGINIHFDTAPAVGAIITANYTTEAIAKDANHVYDLTLTITLNEHTG